MGSRMLVLGLSGRKLTFSGIPNAKDQRVEPRRPLPEGPATGGAPCGWRRQPGGPEPCLEGGILTLPLALPSDLGSGCSVAGASLNWFLLFMSRSAGGYSAIGQQRGTVFVFPEFLPKFLDTLFMGLCWSEKLRPCLGHGPWPLDSCWGWNAFTASLLPTVDGRLKA